MTSPTKDLASLDRDVARAHAAVLRFRAEQRRHPDASLPDPLEGFHHVAGQKAYATVAAYPASATEEPVRAGLLRWIHALTEVRVTSELEAEIARATRKRTGLVRLEQTEETSYDEAWRGAVFGKEQRIREAWLDAAAGIAPVLAPLARDAADRRVEVARRLGLELSATEEGLWPSADLEKGARTLLQATRDLRDEMWRSVAAHRDAATPKARLSVCIGEALARDASEGWPARLTSRWFQDEFREMHKGARITLDPPRVSGASSFARGLYRFGFQIREGGRNGLPFCVAKDPGRTDADRIGFVFGALPLTRVFQRKLLGLNARVAARQIRSLARTALLEASIIAGRWLLTRDGHAPSRVQWEEVMYDIFGGPIDARFMGAWPARRGDETPRLEALLTARSLEGQLVSSFDEDWFRNPKAGSFFRARAGGPARVDDSGEREPEKRAAELGRFFEEAHG